MKQNSAEYQVQQENKITIKWVLTAVSIPLRKNQLTILREKTKILCYSFRQITGWLRLYQGLGQMKPFFLLSLPYLLILSLSVLTQVSLSLKVLPFWHFSLALGLVSGLNSFGSSLVKQKLSALCFLKTGSNSHMVKSIWWVCICLISDYGFTES